MAALCALANIRFGMLFGHCIPGTATVGSQPIFSGFQKVVPLDTYYMYRQMESPAWSEPLALRRLNPKDGHHMPCIWSRLRTLRDELQGHMFVWAKCKLFLRMTQARFPIFGTWENHSSHQQVWVREWPAAGSDTNAPQARIGRGRFGHWSLRICDGCSRLVGSSLGPCVMLGSLKDIHFAHVKHGFFHQTKGNPPYTRQCSGV